MSINLKDVRLPKKINPCPILEAIVELRFESPFPPDAIFGILYNEFKAEYSNLQELPILQLPELVRKQDPALKHQPYYKLFSQDKKFIFQIGARVVSLINLNPYDGWSVFSGKLKNMIERLKKLSVIDAYTRVGIRYINGFDFNIFEKINLSLCMSKYPLIDFDASTRMEIPSGEFINTLQIANNAQVKKADGITKGSVIDIDAHIENPPKDIIETIEQGHLEEKKLFFALLKEEFLKKEFNPEY